MGSYREMLVAAPRDHPLQLIFTAGLTAWALPLWARKPAQARGLAEQRSVVLARSQCRPPCSNKTTLLSGMSGRPTKVSRRRPWTELV